MSEKIAVSVRKLEKIYPGTDALRGVDIEFPAGKITGLIGPNGSGKSTLLRSIAGLTRPTSGKIQITGVKSGRRRKEDIAFLPELNHFYKGMKIKEMVDLYNNQFSNFSREKAAEIIKFMNLNPDNRIKNLSKGMVGRVKLVLTLAREVPLIIMDEPLGGIDPKSRASILESLISEFDAEKQTIILSTHEVMEAERFFDYVVFLEEGQVKLQGDADNLRQEKKMSIQDITREVLI